MQIAVSPDALTHQLQPPTMPTMHAWCPIKVSQTNYVQMLEPNYSHSLTHPQQATHQSSSRLITSTHNMRQYEIPNQPEVVANNNSSLKPRCFPQERNYTTTETVNLGLLHVLQHVCMCVGASMSGHAQCLHVRTCPVSACQDMPSVCMCGGAMATTT